MILCIVKGVKKMSWRERMKEFGSGNFTFLSTDGEIITFVVVGDPVLLRSNFKGKEQGRIGCPVVTEDGYVLFITGKRCARKISKCEPLFGTNAISVIRHGIEGDTDSRYEVKVSLDGDLFSRLRTIAERDVTPELIQESIDEASETLGS